MTLETINKIHGDVTGTCYSCSITHGEVDGSFRGNLTRVTLTVHERIGVAPFLVVKKVFSREVIITSRDAARQELEEEYLGWLLSRSCRDIPPGDVEFEEEKYLACP